jgi:hypothetical protein
MPEPTPEGPIGHFAEFVEKHIAPDIADIKTAVAGLETDGDKTLTWVQAHAANAQQLAGLVLDLVKAVDPADATLAASLVSRAEAIAAEAAKIAGEVLPQDAPGGF